MTWTGAVLTATAGILARLGRDARPARWPGCCPGLRAARREEVIADVMTETTVPAGQLDAATSPAPSAGRVGGTSITASASCCYLIRWPTGRGSQ